MTHVLTINNISSLESNGTITCIIPVLLCDDACGNLTNKVNVTFSRSECVLNAVISKSAKVRIYASVGDFVWVDGDGDGIQDVGEVGLVNVTVNLYNETGVVVDTMVTNASGYYEFTGLVPGNYSVGFVLPGGYVFSPQDQGSNDSVDSDADTTTGQTTSITLVSGENNLSWDAGMYKLNFSGIKFFDENKNGVYDNGDYPLEGWNITLYNESDVLIAWNITNSTGHYFFDNLTPGLYVIKEVLPSGWTNITPAEQTVIIGNCVHLYEDTDMLQVYPDSAVSFVGETRIGDRGGAGQYELDIHTSSPFTIQNQTQYPWVSGQEESFWLSYNATANQVTYAVNNTHLSWVGPTRPFSDILIRTRATKQESSIIVENLVIEDSLGNLYTLSNQCSRAYSNSTYDEGAPRDILVIRADDILESHGVTLEDGFNLTGTQTLTWSDTYLPSQSQLAYQIKVGVVNQSFDFGNWRPDPVINKSVGSPSCIIIPNIEYCVTTDTLITINASVTGGSLVNVSYRVNGGPWINITNVLPYVFDFSSYGECNHTLDIVVIDDLGNMVWDNETFHVDDSPPEIVKVVGEPNCTIVVNESYCVTTDTPVTIDMTNLGCCDEGVVIEYNNGSGWVDITGVLPFTHYFSEECNHWLNITAYDCLGHVVWDNETFFVDDTFPVIEKTVGDPNCTIVENETYCVTTDTVITINASDLGCCDNLTVEYQIWNGTWGEVVDITGQLPFELNFAEECMHWVNITAFDCLGHVVWDNETFFVDDTFPVIEKTIGDPHCTITEGLEYCVTTGTNVSINVSDAGCCENLTVLYRVWNGTAWSPGWTEITESLPLSLIHI